MQIVPSEKVCVCVCVCVKEESSESGEREYVYHSNSLPLCVTAVLHDEEREPLPCLLEFVGEQEIEDGGHPPEVDMTQRTSQLASLTYTISAKFQKQYPCLRGRATFEAARWLQ